MKSKIEQTADILFEELIKLRDGNQTPAVLEAMSNAAGKMISAVKVMNEYARLVGASPTIELVEGSWLKRHTKP